MYRAFTVCLLLVAGASAGCGPTDRPGGAPPTSSSETSSSEPSAAVLPPPRRPPRIEERALHWLAARQAADGGWQEEVADGAATADDPALTGLVILAFLGEGYTNRGRHPFAETVAAGLRFLKHHQAADGTFRPTSRPGDLRDHVPAAHAMVEAFGMTGSPLWSNRALSALGVIAKACDGGDALLRDPEVAAQALLTVLSARMIDEDLVQRRERPAAFALELRRFGPLTASRTQTPQTGPSLALGLLTRLVFEGNDTEEAGEALRALAKPIVAQPLAWAVGNPPSGPSDWALLNVVLEAVPGGEAAAWQRAARDLVRRAATAHGFWDPATLPGYDGDRIRLTVDCLGVLWYRCYDMLRVARPGS